MRIIISRSGQRVRVLSRREAMRAHALKSWLFSLNPGPVEVPTGFETW